MARHREQYTMTFEESFKIYDEREEKSIDFSNQEKRIKSLEEKMDFLCKKLNVELPSTIKNEYSNWQEFLNNLGIQYNEDIIFLLEQNFNLPISKKNLKNDVERNAQYLITKYGYEFPYDNNSNDLPF